MGLLSRGFCAIGVMSLSLLWMTGCSGGGAKRAWARAQDQHLADPAPPPLSAAADVPHVTHVTQQISSPLSASSTTHDLRVMSFNVRVAIFIDAMNHWRFRKELLVETIRNFDPDLLGTQEAIARQSDYLREQLPDYDFVGVGRNDGALRGEMCGVFFRKNRFEKLEAGHFWLSKNPEQPGSKSWGTAAPRMVTWLKLRDRVDGRVLCLFNTHFDHRGRRAREESAKLLRQKIDAIAGDLPVIITGDFNAKEDSRPYRTLIAGAEKGAERYTDTYRAVNHPPSGRGDGTHHSFRGKQRGARIDWIVTCDEFSTVSASIDRTQERGRYPSDHFPVTAVIRPVMPVGVARTE